MGTAGKFAYAELTLQFSAAAARYSAKTGSCVFQRHRDKVWQFLGFSVNPRIEMLATSHFTFACNTVHLRFHFPEHSYFIAARQRSLFMAAVHMSSLSPPQSLLNGKTSALSGPGQSDGG